MTDRKVSNIYGQPYDYPKEQITSLHQIQPGDHLVWENTFHLYWHHMIAEEIGDGKVHVIHYYNGIKAGSLNSAQHCSVAKVRRDSFSFESTRFYRIVYEEGLTYSPEETVSRARARHGELSYNLVTNNCEHFAKQCKIGQPQCQQVWTLAKNVLASVFGTITKFLADFGLSEAAKQLTKYVERVGISNLWEVLRTAPYELSKSGVLTTIVTELAFLYKDFSDIYDKMNSGKITKTEFQEAVIKRVIGAFLAIVLCVAASLFCVEFLCAGWLVTLGVTFIANVIGRISAACLSSYVTKIVQYIKTKLKVD